LTIDSSGDAIISTTEMEHVTQPKEVPAEEPAPRGSIPPASEGLRSPARFDWPAGFQSRERRWWTIALTATLLISAVGLGLLYVDDTNNQTTIRGLTTQNQSLTGRNQILHDQLDATQANLTASLGELARTKAELEHPTLGVWNVPVTLHGPNEYLSATVPDTFTYHLRLKASGPISVSILSTSEFTNAVECVYNGRANTDWCMHHSGATWGVLGVTSVDHDFVLAEGCASYLAVITSPGTVRVTPNVSVTYNPASRATGDCS
jgi:outer membrane murein-binding lipoprotein Lpp